MAAGAEAAALRFELRAARAEISKLHRQLNALSRTVNRQLEQVRADSFTAISALAAQQQVGSQMQQAGTPSPSVPFTSQCSSELPRGMHSLRTPFADAAADLCLASAERQHGSAVGPVDAGGWAMQPIGRIESCFVTKNGTPRQASLAPSAEARLRLRWGTNPAHALEGLECFSHVWLIWIFDQNDAAAVKAKVKPPRLGGAPTGLFACRTPHRPCPIGLSLVPLREVRGDTLILGGADLVDGTPVLDIKPYLPYADSPPPHSVRVGEWAASAGHSAVGAPESQPQPHPTPLISAAVSASGDGVVVRLEAASSNLIRARSPSFGGRRVTVSALARRQIESLCVDGATLPAVEGNDRSGGVCGESEELAGEVSPKAASDNSKVLRFFRGKPRQAEDALVQALAADPRSTYRRERCEEQVHYVNIDGLDAACVWTGDQVVVRSVRVAGPRCPNRPGEAPRAREFECASRGSIARMVTTGSSRTED